MGKVVKKEEPFSDEDDERCSLYVPCRLLFVKHFMDFQSQVSGLAPPFFPFFYSWLSWGGGGAPAPHGYCELPRAVEAIFYNSIFLGGLLEKILKENDFTIVLRRF